MNNFTPEQIEQFLEQFFNVVGRRQYIGARYVPLFGRKDESSIEWDNTKPYEPLTIVLYQGDSYTSRTYVPTGIAITDTAYWANTGNYNAQVEAYRQEVLNLGAIIPSNLFDETNTVKKYVDDTFDNVKFVREAVPVNVLSLGFDNTGVEDITDAFNTYIEQFPLYFPCGVYRVNGTLSLKNSVVGAFENRFGNAAEPVFESYGIDKVFDVNVNDSFITIENIVVKCKSTAIPIYIEGDITNTYTTIKKCRLEDFESFGIYQADRVSNVRFGTRDLFIQDCMLFGKNLSDSTGIYYGKRSGDNRINNVEIMRTNKGIVLQASYLYGSNLHIWCGANGNTMPDALYDTTCAIRNLGGWVYLANVYTDTCRTHIYNHTDDAKTTIINHMIYGDNSTINRQGISVAAAINASATNSRITILGGQYIFNDNYDSLTKLVNVPNDNRICIKNVVFTSDSNSLPNTYDALYSGSGANQRKSYNIEQRTAGTNEYLEVARFEAAPNTGGNFILAISSNFKEKASIVNVEYDSSNVDGVVVTGPSWNILYIKKTNNIISIYTRISNTSRAYNVTLISSSQSLIMFNPYDIIGFTFDRTFDASGMINIT